MSASEKTWTANAPEMPRRTSPSSTASPSTCSDRTKHANSASKESASKLDGTTTTSYNYSGIKMRRPWCLAPVDCLTGSGRVRKTPVPQQAHEMPKEQKTGESAWHFQEGNYCILLIITTINGRHDWTRTSDLFRVKGSISTFSSTYGIHELSEDPLSAL